MEEQIRGGVTGLTLVLGGGGFLGLHAVQAAVAEGSRRACPGVVSLSRRPQDLPADVEGVVADLLRPGELEAQLERVRPARVLLLAALSRLADCERHPAEARAVNADLPLRAARWCAAAGARLVHVSTDLVFGATDAPPGGLREEHPIGPVSVYGASKADGEAGVQAEDPRALIVRLPLLYGDSRGRGLGASDSLLAAVARGERPALFQDEWRTPLEVSAAARALAELLFRPDAPRGLLHVAGPQRVERHELGLAVLCAAGHSRQHALALVRPSTRSEAGQSASRPRDVSLDCARARGLLETTLPDLDRGLSTRAS